MRIGFVGLGNLGSKLAGSLLRNGIDLVVRDLDEAVVRSFIERGATSVASPRELAESCDSSDYMPALAGNLRRGHGGR